MPQQVGGVGVQLELPPQRLGVRAAPELARQDVLHRVRHRLPVQREGVLVLGVREEALGAVLVPDQEPPAVGLHELAERGRLGLRDDQDDVRGGVLPAGRLACPDEGGRVLVRRVSNDTRAGQVLPQRVLPGRIIEGRERVGAQKVAAHVEPGHQLRLSNDTQPTDDEKMDGFTSPRHCSLEVDTRSENSVRLVNGCTYVQRSAY